MRADLGRHVFGAAAFAFGIIALTCHNFNEWQQLKSLWNTPGGEALVYGLGAAQIVGGLAIQFRRTARLGAAVLGCTYLFFALRWVPGIVAKPLVYGSWGNLFEQLSLVSGALIVLGAWRAGLVVFGICVISFTLEQALYLADTASFVPKWIPPNQMFWSVVTTIAFALAAVSILSGYQAKLASVLLTVMIALFGLLIWLPAVIAAPGSQLAWGGNAQNWAIAGAAWIVADLLRARAQLKDDPAALIARADAAAHGGAV